MERARHRTWSQRFPTALTLFPRSPSQPQVGNPSPPGQGTEVPRGWNGVGGGEAAARPLPSSSPRRLGAWEAQQLSPSLEVPHPPEASSELCESCWSGSASPAILTDALPSPFLWEDDGGGACFLRALGRLVATPVIRVHLFPAFSS